MRTTVDLPPALHQRALSMARAQNRSLSSVVADLAMRGAAQLDEPLELAVDSRTGLHVLSIGRRITTSQVAELLDES